MDELLAIAPFGFVLLPTLVLTLWPRGRRFAHLPLAAILIVGGAFISINMGVFLKVSSEAPARYRCGDPFFIPLMGLVSLGVVTFLGGAVLTSWSGSRAVGRQILLWVLPLFLATCIVSGLAGRYIGW
jgi:hypothetical protein